MQSVCINQLWSWSKGNEVLGELFTMSVISGCLIFSSGKHILKVCQTFSPFTLLTLSATNSLLLFFFVWYFEFFSFFLFWQLTTLFYFSPRKSPSDSSKIYNLILTQHVVFTLFSFFLSSFIQKSIKNPYEFFYRYLYSFSFLLLLSLHNNIIYIVKKLEILVEWQRVREKNT